MNGESLICGKISSVLIYLNLEFLKDKEDKRVRENIWKNTDQVVYKFEEMKSISPQ